MTGPLQIAALGGKRFSPPQALARDPHTLCEELGLISCRCPDSLSCLVNWYLMTTRSKKFSKEKLRF